MDFSLEAIDFLTKHGAHKWALVVLAGAVVKILKAVAEQWLSERKILLAELTTSRADTAKLAENHITHLQAALQEGQEKIADALKEVAKSQVESASSINHMTERLKEGFTDLKETLRDQRQM